MTFAVWPLTVNAYALRNTYTEQPERYVNTFTPGHGDPIESPATSRETAIVSYDGRYTQAEWDALRLFYFETLSSGVLPFALINPETGRLGIYKFTQAPQKREVKQQKRRASISLRQLSDVEAETQTLTAAMSVAPSVERALIINNAVYGLKKKSLWSKASGIWFPAAHDIQAAKLNWISRALLTAVGGTTFTADSGYSGNGTSGYLDTGADVTTFLTQNAGSLWVYPTANTQEATGAGDAGSLSSGNVRLLARSTSNDMRVRANDTVDVAIASITDARELFGWSRSAAGAYVVYHGLTATAETDASAAISGNLVFLRSSAAFSARRLGFMAAFSSALSATDQANLRIITQVYLRQVGAI